MQLHVTKVALFTKLLYRLDFISEQKMSCDYANGLSNYDDKGVLGVPEVKKSKNIEKFLEICLNPSISGV